MSDYPQFHQPLDPCNATVQRCPVSASDADTRILIMRTGAFGDILMATPLLAALRAAYPAAHVTWMVEPKYKECIDANPYIDEVITFNGGYWKQKIRHLNFAGWALCALKFSAQLRSRRYDVFVSLQPEEYPALLKGVRARTTIGIFDTFRRFVNASDTSDNARLYDHAYTFSELPTHRTDQYLLALNALRLAQTSDKHMRMGFTAEDAASAASFLAQAGAGPDTPYVVIAPTTTWQTRNWPAERFIELGDALAKRGYRIVLVGNRRNRRRERETLEIVTDIGARMNPAPIMAMDTLSFRQLAALINRADLAVSGDTAPMHLAAALDTPFIGIFGPTAPAWYGPLVGKGKVLAHGVPCGPCDQERCKNGPPDQLLCMRLITVDEVLASADLLLGAPVMAL